ncbi:MAG: hypothetical protein ACI9R3_001089 [Verrucomicrobiales bacterium]
MFKNLRTRVSTDPIRQARIAVMLMSVEPQSMDEIQTGFNHVTALYEVRFMAQRLLLYRKVVPESDRDEHLVTQHVTFSARWVLLNFRND